MAGPINFNVVLEGEDAKKFIEGFKQPKVTPKKLKMFKEAQNIYNANPL
jgi:hypothetical protein